METTLQQLLQVSFSGHLYSLLPQSIERYYSNEKLTGILKKRVVTKTMMKQIAVLHDIFNEYTDFRRENKTRHFLNRN
jgi:hypothetical protein